MNCQPTKLQMALDEYLIPNVDKSGTHFIVVDGPSGSGKTTLARLLAESIGGVYLHCPPAEFQSTGHEIKRMDDQVQFLFYLAANVSISQQVSAMLRRSHVVLDRYVYTTIAWYGALGVKTRIDIGSLELLRPDVAFLLLASNEVVRRRRVRMDGRSYTQADAVLESGPDVYAQYLAQMQSFGLSEIETSDLAVDQILAQMIRQVNKLSTIS